MTAENTENFEFIYELDSGGVQSFTLIAPSITNPTCTDSTGKIHYYIQSISPDLPIGIQLTFTEGASPSINCQGKSNPAGPFSIKIGTFLNNG